MIPTMFEVKVGMKPDPHPPIEDLDPDRQILMVLVKVDSTLVPAHQFMIVGEAIPMLVELLQKVCQEYPALTTERVAKEGIGLTGEQIGAFVPGPEGKQ